MTVLIAIPVLVICAVVEVYVWPHILDAMSPNGPSYTRHVGPLSDGYIRLVHWSQEEVAGARRAPRAARLRGRGDGSRDLDRDPRADGAAPRWPSSSTSRACHRTAARSAGPCAGRRRFGSSRSSSSTAARRRSPRPRRSSPTPPSPAGSRRGSAISEAIAHPPADPVVPRSDSAPNSGTPLTKKLGIGSDSVVVLVDRARRFRGRPSVNCHGGSTLRRGNRGAREITVWFEIGSEPLEANRGGRTRAAGEGMLWIAWPKASSNTRHRPDPALRDGGRPWRRPRRQQGLRDRRGLVGAPVHPAPGLSTLDPPSSSGPRRERPSTRRAATPSKVR